MSKVSGTRHWLFEPHANVEFGELKVCNRFSHFLASNIASAVIRLPLDLVIWVILFYLGHRIGGAFFN